MNLTENRFEIEVEMIAKVAKARLTDPGESSPRRARIYEVAVTYSGRTYEEGKKIRWQDGLRALWAVARHGFGPEARARPHPRRDRVPHARTSDSAHTPAT